VSAAPTHIAWANPAPSLLCGSPSGTSFALVYFNCGVAGTFTGNVALTDNAGNPVTNLGNDVTVSITGAGIALPATLTIAHGQSTSSVATTYTASLSLTRTSDTATASATGLTSATVTLHVGLV
jgi:hypothetical protein